MTQPGAPVTQGELMRLLVQQVPALARRSVAVPSKRLGTVETVDGYGVAQVTLDGDTAASSIQVAAPGGVAPADRVVVDFYPPHGALVTGVMGPPASFVRSDDVDFIVVLSAAEYAALSPPDPATLYVIV